MLTSNKIGFSTNIYDNPADMVNLVDFITDDYKIVEIEFEKDFRVHLDENPSSWNEIKEKLKSIKSDKDISFSCHAPYLGVETDIANSDEITRLVAVDYLSKYIVMSSEVGAKYLTIHPGYVEVNSSGVDGFSFEQLDKSIGSLSKIAKENDILLLLENTGNEREKYIVLSDEQHDSLCKYDNVFLTLDIVHYHSFYYECSPEEYYSKLKSLLPSIKNAHFNDVLNGKHIHLPLNKGNFNFNDVLSYMVEEGYKGNFIIEESGGGYEPVDFFESGKQYMNLLNNRSN
ncbi:sugar phosphate isomerase/epimerase family protein [Photobacterium sp. 1_MG-2023]|uniref:sugar phosphate isomerase/epimerase family protein n=1 Tax=Photobacterium sp. 1_MG-2023 TaxID=3062646 RepID=UPI0026E494DB|nr:sugar phosphate isomerase/epimerase family protein [Photobacterium sp. 1_MG-2023]MDO6709018.1 sugar phosphate isomerase/epimerase family protein [Photobacterium sp. 1_MG-2023]